MSYLRYLAMAISLWALFSCCQNSVTIKGENIKMKWMNKKIQFPNDQFIDKENDTNTLSYTKLLNREYKIVLYMDSTGCFSCKLRLSEWKRLIQEADSLFSEKLSFLFFFHPNNTKELQYLLKYYCMTYPVFIDNKNQFTKLNHLSGQWVYQCFLLDKNNKVMLIGNPTLNPEIWELYKRQIRGEEIK